MDARVHCAVLPFHRPDLYLLLQVTNICGSIVFTLLLENQAWIYAPAIGGLIMVVLGFVGLKEAPAMKITDRTFRLASGVLAILAMLCLLLPSHVVSVPESITADPADAAAMNRSTPLWKEMLGNEPNLRAEVAEKGVYGSVLTGDIEVLVPDPTTPITFRAFLPSVPPPPHPTPI